LSSKLDAAGLGWLYQKLNFYLICFLKFIMLSLALFRLFKPEIMQFFPNLDNKKGYQVSLKNLESEFWG